MSQLIVNDLDFWLEDEVPASSRITGGAKYLAGYTRDVFTDYDSKYIATYTISKKGYTAVVGGEVAGVAAGALAGAIAVGKAQIAVFASASGGII